MAAWPDGIDRVLVGELDSTNLEGRRLADGIKRPTWILAESQTCGRGRRGREWVSPKGNFHATLVMPLKGPLRHAALRSMVASISLRDALGGIVGTGADLKTKWPNDVLLNGGKVAGILLETAGIGDRVCVLIGFGVNLVSAPHLPERSFRAPKPISLHDATGVSISPIGLLERLARAYELRESQFRASGIEPIRCDWVRHASGIGKEATFRMERSDIRGIFESVDSDGCAVVLAAGARHKIAAADLLLG